MKTLIVAAALAAVVASPAFARTQVRHHMAPAYSQSEATYPGQSYLGHDDAVYQGNEYVGRDPDARIRLEMRRDTAVNGAG